MNLHVTNNRIVNVSQGKTGMSSWFKRIKSKRTSNLPSTTFEWVPAMHGAEHLPFELLKHRP